MARLGRSFPARPIIKGGVPAPPAGGSSFTGTPGVSGLVKTGQAPALVVAFNFAAGISSLAKTGQTPSITIGFNFAPAVSSLVKTGETPTLTTAFKFTPAVSSLAKTGQAPDLTSTFSFTPLVASLAKTGQAPTLTVPFSGTPGLASLLKTGNPILLQQTAIRTGAGSPSRKKRRLTVEVDGRAYAVNSEREAVAVLRRAKERIRQEAKARVAAIEREPAQIILPPDRPEVQVYGDDEDLRDAVMPQLERFQRELDAVFAQADLRMQAALAEQDDEDIFLLL